MLNDDLNSLRALLGNTVAANDGARQLVARHGREVIVQAALAALAQQPTATDRRLAKLMLGAAADAGHAGAALAEIGLTVTGSDDAGSWQVAQSRLRRTAQTDALAAQHLELLEAMGIGARGEPQRRLPVEQLADVPRVALCRNFCTPIEAAHIVSIVMDTMEPATVFDPRTGGQMTHPIRTSHNAAIGPLRESLVVAAINRRIAALSNTRVDQGEPLAVLRYAPGQQYRLHNDAIPGEPNQRIKTVLIYLSDGYEGGETEFPDLGIRVRGRQGDALMFDNADEQGRPLARARHAGLPVTAGVKWLATRWIRAEPIDPWSMSQSLQTRS